MLLHKVRRKSDGLFYGKLGWTQEGELFESVQHAVQYLKDNSHKCREESVAKIDDLSDLEVVTYSTIEHCTCNLKVYLKRNPIEHPNKALKRRGAFLYYVLSRGEYIDSRNPSNNFLLYKDVNGCFFADDILKIPHMNILGLRDIVNGFTHWAFGKNHKVFRFHDNYTKISIQPAFRRVEREPGSEIEGLKEKVEETVEKIEEVEEIS